jgi:hypothetical protein
MHSIRDAALMLRINENEAKVVECIVEGLTPTQRAVLSFRPPFHLPAIGAAVGSGSEHFVRGSDEKTSVYDVNG